MGELAPLTEGLLDAPGAAESARAGPSYNKLDPHQLQDFEKRITEHMAKEEAALEKIKTEHSQKMEELRRSRAYIKADRRLRDIARGRPRSAQGQDSAEDQKRPDGASALVAGRS